MKFLIFCGLWTIIGFFEYLLGKQYLPGLATPDLLVIVITTSWLIALLIVLFFKLSINPPASTHEVYGFPASRIVDGGTVDGMFIFGNKDLHFSRFDEQGIAQPYLDIPYSEIKSYGFGETDTTIYISTDKAKYDYVGTHESLQSTLNWIPRMKKN